MSTIGQRIADYALAKANGDEAALEAADDETRATWLALPLAAQTKLLMAAGSLVLERDIALRRAQGPAQ